MYMHEITKQPMAHDSQTWGLSWEQRTTPGLLSSKNRERACEFLLHVNALSRHLPANVNGKGCCTVTSSAGHALILEYNYFKSSRDIIVSYVLDRAFAVVGRNG